MAQRAFDHLWNTLADPEYASQCRRKNKLRQRKSPIGNYQIDEDVWARHPTNGVMYIATVIDVDPSHRTYRVTFVDDGGTFALPVTHLRHVTLEDIQCKRHVDYGHGWTKHTRIGTIVTYDRYGEQQHVQYTVTPQDVFNCFFATEESNRIDIDTVDTTTSSNSANQEEDYSHTSKSEAIWVRITDPEDPSATFSTCPIWNASSYAEAEKQALELCNQDIHYREAVQRAQHRMKKSQQLDSSHLEKLDSLQSQEHLAHVGIQPIDVCTLSHSTEESTPIDKSSPDSVEQQLYFDNIQDNSMQPAISMQTSKELPVVQERGTQTESFALSLVAKIDHTDQQIIRIHSDRSTKHHCTSTYYTEKITNRYASKYYRSILQNILSTIMPIIDEQRMHWSKYRLQRSYVYSFSKHLTLVLLAVMLTYHLLIGLSLSHKHIDSGTTTTTRKHTTGVTHAITMAIFIHAMLPLSTISNGPSRSVFEQWPYPFTVP